MEFRLDRRPPNPSEPELDVSWSAFESSWMYRRLNLLRSFALKSTFVMILADGVLLLYPENPPVT